MLGSPHEVAYRVKSAGRDQSLESEVTCVLTRFVVRRPWDFVATYRDFRRVMEQAKRVDGLLQSVFLIESPNAFLTLSIWRNERAIAHFGTVATAHVHAGNEVFHRLRYTQGRGPELWSTHWRLTEVSNNANWGDLSLTPLVSTDRGSRSDL
jgi:hypothetical protein